MKLTNYLKRQLSKVLCSALVLSSVAVGGVTQVAQAASKTEIETYGTTLTLNETATGVLKKKDEQDWYIFNITERGYFSVDLKRNDSADADKIHKGWKYSLYHEDDLVNSVSSIESITNKYDGKELPLPEGRYYVCVEASDNWNDSYVPLDCQYDIKVNFTKSEEWEHEYNDTNVTPNSIEVNQTYFGNLHNETDVDWYKVMTPKNGTIQMDFGPDVSTDMNDIHDGWNVAILDAELNTVREYTYINKWTPQVIPYESGVFYIRVKASNYWSIRDTEPVNCIYNLQLKFIPTTDWETENNGEYAKANVITSGNEYHGILTWETDEDWYRIDNETDATATLQFRVDDSVSVDDIHDGWRMVVYNADREQITEINEIKKTTAEEDIRLPKGAVYVKVCADSYWSIRETEPVDCIYHLTVTITPVHVAGTDNDTPTSQPTETPTDTSTPTNTPKPIVTAKPINTAKPISTAKPQNSIVTPKPGTTIQPISTTKPTETNNAVIEKAITTSKVTTSTVTSQKKKSVYLRWKKQKYADGYEVYRSTKKKNGYKKVKTVKGVGKTSWTDKKVKGGMTYYYKIRAYRNINRRKAVSGFSKAKRVKVKK